MENAEAKSAAVGPVRQSGEISLWMGKNVGLDLRVKLTSGGILAIGGLVSSILLSTAVLVAVSVRESHR
ncbi:hypothetical protein [Croceibacterium ferulae]|uniref:hypothetical protein n=1 Tax=Croceibacterium ferulae TaxID=1854641 RepID=UPI000EB2B3B5|nr:hypothetical protein [Croceibacterium ferulae]